MAEEITYYRFLSEVRAFLSKLLKDPIKAQPSVYLKNRDVTRKKLIDDLLKRDVLERHEKILDPTNSDEKEAKYIVKYKVHKKDFEKRIHRLYIKYFEKNINESIDEITAYHGSPQNFKRFKEKYINSFYYGWGTYLTVDTEEGEMYATENGYLYEVNIPEDNGFNYLYSGNVDEEEYNRIYSILIKAFPKYQTAISIAIENCKKYNNLNSIFNEYGIEGCPANAKEISKIFNKNGIIGVVFKTIYVIFDRKNIEIVNRVQMQQRRQVAEEVEHGIKLNEEGEGGGVSGGEGCGGATSTFSVGGDTTRGDMGYDVPFGMLSRPGYLADRDKKKKKTTNKILGKTIQAEMRKPKKIYITEEQFNYILKEEIGAGGATTTTSVASNTTDGQLGPVRPGCMTFTKSDGSPDDSAFERKPGFSVKHVGDK